MTVVAKLSKNNIRDMAAKRQIKRNKKAKVSPGVLPHKPWPTLGVALIFVFFKPKSQHCLKIFLWCGQQRREKEDCFNTKKGPLSSPQVLYRMLEEA